MFGYENHDGRSFYFIDYKTNALVPKESRHHDGWGKFSDCNKKKKTAVHLTLFFVTLREKTQMAPLYYWD